MPDPQEALSKATGLSRGRSRLQETMGDILGMAVDVFSGAVGLPTGIDSKATTLGELLAMAPVLGGVKAIKSALGGAKGPIRAYHGSPHDFDQFSLSKIGTGEGAQAYGHGLYFAENKNVARDYRDKLSRPELTIDGQSLPPEVKGRDFLSLSDDAIIDEAARELLRSSYKGGKEVPSIADDAMGSARVLAHRDPAQRDHWLSVEQRIKNMAPKLGVREGRMYEVNIHADPEDFLDWDAPLSQQSEKVRGVLTKHGVQETPEDVVREAESQLQEAWGRYEQKLKAGQDVTQIEREIRGIETDISTLKKTTQMTGRDAYRDVAPRMADPVATERLKAAGIPGIKYLDGASRSAGQGSRNYVVFDDKLISIVKKYGIAAALSAGAINEMQARQLQEQGYQ